MVILSDMQIFFADLNDHGQLCGTNHSRSEVLLLPESSALLGATGTAASCCGRGRGG